MRILISLILLTPGLLGQAQEKISLTGAAPRVVEVGEYFRLSYSVNSKGSTFTGPRLDNFTFSGPMLSTNMSTQIINGKVSQSNTYTYNYTVQAAQEGKFKIPAASVVVEGKTYRSNELTIEVVKANPARQQQPANRTPSQRNVQPKTITPEDLFVRVNINRRNVFKGEQILATIKVYTRVNLSRFGEIKLPSFQGFWAQEIPTSEQISLVRENVDGRIYNVGTIKKSILIPQQTGDIVIDPFELECFVNIQSQSRSIFDDFFGNYQTISKKLVSPKITVKVKPLPTGAPANFSGAVGRFSMVPSIDKTSLQANEALTLQIKVQGSGNFKLIDPPVIDFPADFEAYDPKIKDNFSTKESGISGSRTFEYLAIPRYGGDFTLPAASFSYFDPSSNSYKTLNSPSYSIQVEKSTHDQASNLITRSSGTEVRMLGKDIRYIKTVTSRLRSHNLAWVQSTWFYLIYLIIVLISLLLIIWIVSVQKKRADHAGMQQRLAGKVSKKRLRKAQQALKDNNREAFLNELLKAIWGYLGDKLNIDPSGYNRDLIEEYFNHHQGNTEIKNQLMTLLDECEYIRYAPTRESAAMDKLLHQSEEILGKLGKMTGKKTL